jgi:hypothetical protein
LKCDARAAFKNNNNKLITGRDYDIQSVPPKSGLYEQPNKYYDVLINENEFINISFFSIYNLFYIHRLINNGAGEFIGCSIASAISR